MRSPPFQVAYLQVVGIPSVRGMSFDIKTIEVVVNAKEHNPTVLNPDFLRYNKIVPDDWELAENPIVLDPIARVSYKNGVGVTVEPEQATFRHDLEGMPVDQSSVPAIATRYIQHLPFVSYHGVRLNFQGHIAFESEATRSDFLRKRFMRDGPWLTYRGAPATPAVRFFYAIENLNVIMTLQETWYSPKKEAKVPAALVVGSFASVVAHEAPQERLRAITAKIDNWQNLLHMYRELVDLLLRSPGDSN